MSDWHWEPHPDDLLDALPPQARAELDLLAREITVRDSIRGERIMILQVVWFS